MEKKPQDSEKSADEVKREFRTMAREIESALLHATVRRSVFAMALLEEIPSLYELDSSLIGEVSKIKGEQLERLRKDLFRVFAQAGLRTPDEVLKVRIQDLLAKHVADRPKGGRKKKGS